METPVQMRRNAQRCEAFASDENLTDDERRSFLEAAQSWRALADTHDQQRMEEQPVVQAA